MHFIVLSLIVQVALIVHVIRTGRNMLWILAIALLPMAGSLAYAIVEILPEFAGAGRGGGAGRARKSMLRIFDPDRNLRRASAEVEISGNVDARRRLAEELYDRGQYDRVIEVCKAGLAGIFEHEPTLLLELARAQFAKQDFAAARDSLERLARHNPEFKSTAGRLLYARALEESGALEQAESEYAAIAPDYPGAEARLRYGLILKRRGKTADARRVFGDLLASAKIAPAHYRRAQAQWLAIARREMG